MTNTVKNNSQHASIGVIGLAVMGENLARNIANKGYSVAVYNRTSKKVEDFISRIQNNNIIGTTSLEEFCASLIKPRKIILMIRAGEVVDSVINQLLDYLEPEDIIIDGGNSFYKDTQRRYEMLQKSKIRYLGAGISGGEEGALNGPSIMVGGDKDAFNAVSVLLEDISAKVEFNGEIESCCKYLGDDGAGHFVKMIHNGIEYADMQMISEVYYILKNLVCLTNGEIAHIFKSWNNGPLSSYLIEITAEVLAKKTLLEDDGSTNHYVVDKILDVASQKGTGKWTAESSLELGVPTSTIAQAVFSRYMSTLKHTRLEAEKIFYQNHEEEEIVLGKHFIQDLHDALYAAKICCYAQGFQLLAKASGEFNWHLNYSDIAKVWRGGCIIRADFLNDISSAYSNNNSLENLLFSQYFQSKLLDCLEAWRNVASCAVLNAVPAPCLISALSYFDSLSCGHSSANMIQALRDYFGAHMYERIDRPRGEFFHTNWTDNSGVTTSESYSV
ncbi:decarboxylating NADP(+)-dependent phosphogluconate dehydrogenase [Lentisphaerota bacterium WC36G]|nr:decarboxylating NADP(+)-dependent phosphogluconate dehydrogenase [Lentisphaerae bacterium WC36]